MKVTIEVYGMTCDHCQKRVADAIYSLEGVESVEVDLESKRATANFDPQKISLDVIKEAVQKTGYSTEIEEETKEVQVNTEEIQINTEAKTSAIKGATGTASETADMTLEKPE